MIISRVFILFSLFFLGSCIVPSTSEIEINDKNFVIFSEIKKSNLGKLYITYSDGSCSTESFIGVIKKEPGRPVFETIQGEFDSNVEFHFSITGQKISVSTPVMVFPLTLSLTDEEDYVYRCMHIRAAAFSSVFRVVFFNKVVAIHSTDLSDVLDQYSAYSEKNSLKNRPYIEVRKLEGDFVRDIEWQEEKILPEAEDSKDLYRIELTNS